ncbi:MAG: MarC family protein [Bacteroidales bacterium]|nr:MarC family protein [Bacteroidales bacterium]MDE7103466.1 MarC family protein [Bacteroidales bacterium]
MSLHFSIAEIASAFVVLFAVIDITGSIPIIVDLNKNRGGVSAWQAALLSLGILLAFLFLGDALLALFGIDVSSFAVAGSLVIFVLAVEMTFGIEVFRNDGPNGVATIVPLVFPLIAGAGTLTTLLSLRAEYNLLNIVIALILNMIVVYVVIRYVDQVEKIVGKGGIYILRKFFGIILLAISVRLFANNVTSLF